MPKCVPAIYGLLFMLLAAPFVGCASLTNPVANGIPVYMVPDPLLAPSKEGMKRVDLTQLRQEPPEEYVLDAGDTLGVYIEGILGAPESPPPVSEPASPEEPPAVGYPFPIRSDGTISLPYLGEISVAGLTIGQAEQKVVSSYLSKEILRKDDYRIMVTLLRPRYERVMVIRDDGTNSSVSFSNQGLIGFGSSTTISSGNSATGQVVELPAYENDVLNALARTGGLPGEGAIQEVLVYRKETQESDGFALNGDLQSACDYCPGDAKAIRIPLEVPAGTCPQINPEDVILHTGDIITIRAREPELYYTGGLIPSGEFQLPYDRDITVVEALLKARAPVVSGGLSTSNLTGNILNNGLGIPSPALVSVVRKTPGGQQVVIRVDLNEALRDPRQNLLVKAEDVLIMQEREDQAVTRYLSNIFSMDFYFRWVNHQDGSGTGSIVVP